MTIEEAMGLFKERPNLQPWGSDVPPLGRFIAGISLDSSPPREGLPTEPTAAELEDIERVWEASQADVRIGDLPDVIRPS